MRANAPARKKFLAANHPPIFGRGREPAGKEKISRRRRVANAGWRESSLREKPVNSGQERSRRFGGLSRKRPFPDKTPPTALTVSQNEPKCATTCLLTAFLESSTEFSNSSRRGQFRPFPDSKVGLQAIRGQEGGERCSKSTQNYSNRLTALGTLNPMLDCVLV